METAAQSRMARLVESSMKLTPVALVLVSLLGVVVWQPPASRTGEAPVPYPDGYREWTHVKSALASATSKGAGNAGSFQHVYANTKAMAGYRTRAFPEGSIVVFDWLEFRETGGTFAEGPRRQVDVMMKDSTRFAATGGWGFQRFVKDSRTELAPAPTPQQCFACHDQMKKDALVLSTYRP